MTMSRSGLLGPSHLFYSELIEEAEDVTVVGVGRKAPVVLVDLADEALEGMREYDPVTDSTAHFCPFDEEKESAIVSLKDIETAVRSWVDGIASGRQNFYSAREEPPAVKAHPKKQQKKVSNAALADQVAGLMAQIQLLAAQQQEIRDSFQPPASATPVDVGLSGKSHPVVPNVAPTSKVGIPKSTLQVVGPPPKTRVPTVSGRGRSDGSFGGRELRSSCFSRCNCTHTTKHSNHSFGGPLGFWRSPQRTGYRRRRIRRSLREGSCPSGKNAVRSCIRLLELLPVGESAIVQEDVSIIACPTVRGRHHPFWSNDVCLLGETWQFQRPEGSRSDELDIGTCIRQCGPGRFQDLQGVSCTPRSFARSGVAGWELEHCISHQPFGGTSFPDDDGEAHTPIFVGPAFCRHGTSTMECSGTGLHPRDGFAPKQEKRDEARSFSEEGETEVPEKAKASGGGWRQVNMQFDKGEGSSPHAHYDSHLVNSFSREGYDEGLLLEPMVDQSMPLTSTVGSGGCFGDGDSKFSPGKQSSESHTFVNKPRSDLGAWSYLKWCVNLVPLVLRSRTPLASFLSKTISLSKTSETRNGLASTFFPVPIPCFRVFGRMTQSSSVSARHARHISRAIHVIVMSLNFWHFGGKWCDMELLRREPSRQHESLFKRLRFLIKSDWPAEIPDLPKAGRKFPQLTARLSELSGYLTRLGPSANPYEKKFSGYDVPTDNTAMPELSPYRDLDPGRLRIKGAGHWDATSFLGDSLCMVYRHPACIRFTEEPSVVPNNRDSSDTVGRLALLWDVQGLLFVHDRPVGVSSHVRIFNTLKNISQDIGDRRAMNSQEARVGGPSSDLPSGYDICSLIVNPKIQSVAISITDRSDFYHQFLATPSRAYGNTVAPSVPVDILQQTDAYRSFRARTSKKKTREKTGDHLEQFSPSSLLCPEPGHLWISFNSILQGDHSGVEIATESHSNLLRSYGLLQSDCRLVASSPLKSFDEAQGLVIDDFFALSIQDKNTPPASTRSALAYKQAQVAYGRHGLEGSPEKDIVAQPEGKVIGAYINGGRRATSRGMVLVGAPIEKRLGLSVLSLFLVRLVASLFDRRLD